MDFENEEKSQKEKSFPFYSIYINFFFNAIAKVKRIRKKGTSCGK